MLEIHHSARSSARYYPICHVTVPIFARKCDIDVYESIPVIIKKAVCVRKCMKILLEIIVSAVDVSLLLEAGGLVLQLAPTLHALEAGGVPLPLHGAQVELVRDAQAAARAQRGLTLPILHALHLNRGLVNKELIGTAREKDDI